jgi:hypothetical protein
MNRYVLHLPAGYWNFLSLFLLKFLRFTLRLFQNLYSLRQWIIVFKCVPELFVGVIIKLLAIYCSNLLKHAWMPRFCFVWQDLPLGLSISFSCTHCISPCYIIPLNQYEPWFLLVEQQKKKRKIRFLMFVNVLHNKREQYRSTAEKERRLQICGHRQQLLMPCLMYKFRFSIGTYHAVWWPSSLRILSPSSHVLTHNIVITCNHRCAYVIL